MESLGAAYASPDDSSFVARYTARCHCGTVCYEVKADPVDAKICHCRNCQVLHGAPMQWAVIFQKADVRFVCGVESLTFYNSERRTHQTRSERELPCKVACGACGALIADEGRRMWLAFPTLFDVETSGLLPAAFQPNCHIFYGQRVVDLNDGLPKWTGHKDKSSLLDLP
jgi:hypothetical protein